MRREGLLTGQLWNRDAGEMEKVRNKPTNASNSSGRCCRSACQLCHDHPVGKAKAKTKGRRNKLAPSIDEDWALAAPSSRPHDAYAAKVKVSSHALDDDFLDAYDVDAACHAIDVACGATVGDQIFDINAACHAIDVACAFDIDAACHAIDAACAGKVNNNVDGISDSYVDGKTCLVTADDVNLACHINNAVVNIAHDVGCIVDDSSHDDDDDDHKTYAAHDIHGAGSTTLLKAVDDGAKDDERNDNYESVKHDKTSDECHQLATPYNNVVSDGPSVYESNDAEYVEISDACCVSSIDNDIDSLVESDANSLSSDWCHVATSLDTDDWYLC